MRNKSVAVLDIRSSEVCAVVAEKGVNNTFIIKSKYNCAYDGYAEGELLDIGSFVKAVESVVGNTLASSAKPVKEFYVGLPAEFTDTIQTDKVITFNSSQKISYGHLRSLEQASVPDVEEGFVIVNSSPLYYVLSDKRKLVEPVGMVSDSLRARLSFFTCKKSFIDCVLRAFGSFPTVKIFHWIPQTLALADYLLDADKRDGYSVLIDLGYISSSFSVSRGNGIAFSESFSIGIGHLALLVTEALGIPYGAALAFVRQVNLNAKDRLYAEEEVVYEGDRYCFPASELRSVIREGLDGICETIETCRQSFVGKDISSDTLYITGEGVGELRGLTEHISSRLVAPVEVVSPAVPYYDKPRFSSLLSLLSAALNGAQ